MSANRTILTLLIILFVDTQSYFAQHLTRQSYYLSFGAGSPNYNKDYNVDYVKRNFPQSKELKGDFKDFENDSSKERFPMLVSFDLGVYVNNKDTIIKKKLRPITRFSFGVSSQRISRTLVQKFTFLGDTIGVSDTLKIKHYAFTHNYTLFYVGAHTIINSRYIGKREGCRFFLGGGFNLGIGRSKLHAWEAEAAFDVIKTSSNPDVYSYSKQLYKDEVYTKYVSNKLVSTCRLEFPMGAEFTGARKKWHLGMEIIFGRSLLYGSNTGWLNGPYVGYKYYLRWNL